MTREREDSIRIIDGGAVESLCENRESRIMEAVRLAYVAHLNKNTVLPKSTFLRMPSHESNRVIALPAYLGDGFSVAGIKWISSFPDNLRKGIERASAVIIVNSVETGRPEVIIEGSIISAKRTAASAALAANHLHAPQPTRVGLVGCGKINFEVARFLSATRKDIESFLLFDLNDKAATRLRDKLSGLPGRPEVGVAQDIREVFDACSLVSVATTATVPYINELAASSRARTILHVSLRDFGPEVVLRCDNVVDDIDHVCQAQTSMHLTEQKVGNRDFIRCTLAEVMLGKFPARSDERATTIFSPFGLGILDLAVAKLLLDLAREESLGTTVEDFFPGNWWEG
jgi:2,3-diaminopropionate biosynthesis protein SbnB